MRTIAFRDLSHETNAKQEKPLSFICEDWTQSLQRNFYQIQLFLIKGFIMFQIKIMLLRKALNIYLRS